MSSKNENLIFYIPYADVDVDEMTVDELKAYREELQKAIAALDQQEPKDENSEVYEKWADTHEELEDLLDEVLDLLE